MKQILYKINTKLIYSNIWFCLFVGCQTFAANAWVCLLFRILAYMVIIKTPNICKLCFVPLWQCFSFIRDKNAEELEAYYKKKFAETSDRLVFWTNLRKMFICPLLCIILSSYFVSDRYKDDYELRPEIQQQSLLPGVK